jgi:WD40 repeat protein
MTLQGHTRSVNAVAVTPNGRHVVSGSDDTTLRVWDHQGVKQSDQRRSVILLTPPGCRSSAR